MFLKLNVIIIIKELIIILKRKSENVVNGTFNEMSVTEPNNEPRIILYIFVFLFKIIDDDNRIIKSNIKLKKNNISRYTFILITI